MGSGQETVFSVWDLTRRIRQTLEDQVGAVWVEGEISNFRPHSSGHVYFAIKDERAQLSAVLFAGTRATLPKTLHLADGKRVRLFGQVTVFEAQGKYQIKVQRIEEVGVGDLMRRLEELKRRLEAEGLFDPARRKPLPALPQRIGVVTSPTGAAIHDILTVLLRRFPNLQVRLAPVRVQGEGAAKEIVAAVEMFNRVCGAQSEWPADLLIVGRGGGSIEDLWAFNEEIVVRAIAASSIPVISAVGHEVDVTLCDFSSDLRAPTPSAAAELAVPLKTDLESRVMQNARALEQALTQRVTECATRLQRIQSAAVLRQPQRMLESRAQSFDGVVMRLEHVALSRVQLTRQRIAACVGRLQVVRERQLGQVGLRLTMAQRGMIQACAVRVEQSRVHVATLARQLQLLNPLAVVERGYSLTRNVEGQLVRSATDVATGSRLLTQVKDGVILSVVAPDAN